MSGALFFRPGSYDPGKMLLRELKELVQSTADAAFAIDGAGVVVAWNGGAEAMFGLPAGEAVGRSCGSILHGADECGPVCSSRCSVRQAVESNHQIRNFDLQVRTPGGMKWCNVSVLVAEVTGSALPHSIHVIREVDTGKRLELLVRDFIVSGTKLPPEEARGLAAATRSPSREVELTAREHEILRLMARGMTTAKIAGQLHISRTTVNNHIQHILQKLDAHSRLEAIRRAEHAGLI
ncbi:MAG TPA: LuxR C-terminal-related transcriptional regulator [Blastocatellia bacterium]|nr:LuxR C-terminal-related transcriptional regulator [Blastocatellia bacterium]